MLNVSWFMQFALCNSEYNVGVLLDTCMRHNLCIIATVVYVNGELNRPYCLLLCAL